MKALHTPRTRHHKWVESLWLAYVLAGLCLAGVGGCVATAPACSSTASCRWGW